MVVLQARGGRDVLDAMRALCVSPDPARRRLATRVLGELGLPDRSFPEECGDALLALLRDPDDEVRVSAVFALGHLRARRADPALIELRNDPSADIRHGVAFALNGATSPQAVSALLQLMDDPNPLARDRATTAIGAYREIDGPEIREALLKRASDEDIFTRAEALKGLAVRRDKRVAPLMIEELTGPETRHFEYVFEAALELLGISEDEAPRETIGGYSVVDDGALIEIIRARC